MEGLLTHHLISNAADGNYEFVVGENRIVIARELASSSGFFYRRFDPAGDLVSESLIATDESPLVVGVFPTPALLTPKRIANAVYLKFKSPIIVDQKSNAVFYSIMPVEIAIYRQSGDEEILLDAFSLQKTQYALYGSPESGVLCRYKEVEVNTTKDEIEPVRYEEALVRIAIRNSIDKVVKINKVIIPMNNVILDHAHDDSWLPGTVEMSLSHAFGEDVVNVHLQDAKVKPSDKTSDAEKKDSLVFLMDAGY
jgi:hypothetical protein